MKARRIVLPDCYSYRSTAVYSKQRLYVCRGDI
jgi:hypothetical protein